MSSQNEFKGQQEGGNAESNAERDQDHGNMNNGTLGGNMGTLGTNSDQNKSAPTDGSDGTAKDNEGDRSDAADTGAITGTDAAESAGNP